MSKPDRIALLLSSLAVLATYFVTVRVYEAMPHLEDEVAYVWQARVIAAGRLSIPSPPHAPNFLVPFVVDHDGQRFGKYPLGWPALLAIGIFFGARSLVNPLLSGLGVWLTYRLGSKVLGETVGLLAAGLTLTSPFFLMNSGSLLSHSFGLVLALAFVLAWLDSFASQEGVPRLLPTLTAGGSLGVLALTRPWTALAVALPFALHGLYLLARRGWQTRRHLFAVAGIALALAALNFIWQYAVTGDALLNPYTLWWAYDRLGFGPGFGVTEQGHNLHLAWINTRFSLRAGYSDLFGWGSYSWIFLPFGLFALLRQRNWQAILVSSVFVSLLVLYMAYWVGSWLFGPRYYYESLFSVTLLSATGIGFLAGWLLVPGVPWRSYPGWQRARPLLVTAFLALLVSGNLLFYTPIRLSKMRGLYGMERADLAPFQSQQAHQLAPALVIVHPGKWMSYGVLLELENPALDSPFIFAYSRGQRADAELATDFPTRNIFHYYPDEPYRLYTGPRPGS